MKQPQYQKVGDTLWVHFEGRTYTVVLKSNGSSKSRAKHHHGVGDPVLHSPMPGKVLRVNFKIGDGVTKGTTVCVLEAMKMEYALKAPFDGKIKSLFKGAGEQVKLDDPILEIEESK